MIEYKKLRSLAKIGNVGSHSSQRLLMSFQKTEDRNLSESLITDPQILPKRRVSKRALHSNVHQRPADVVFWCAVKVIDSTNADT